MADSLRAHLAATDKNTNVDTLPREAWEHVRLAMDVSGITHREMAEFRGTAYGGTSHFKFAPSRATIASYAEVFGRPVAHRDGRG